MQHEKGDLGNRLTMMVEVYPGSLPGARGVLEQRADNVTSVHMRQYVPKQSHVKLLLGEGYAVIPNLPVVLYS